MLYYIGDIIEIAVVAAATTSTTTTITTTTTTTAAVVFPHSPEALIVKLLIILAT